MPASAGPREVLERLLRGIEGRRWQELPELYAEDAVVEQPLAVPEPTRLEGREAIRKHFAAAGGPLAFRVGNVVVHQTGDPEVIVAEYDYEGRVTTTGRTFRVANIQVLRVRDGLIVASRDYHNHLALAAALGRLPQLVSAFGEQEPA
ncbi:MAG TPA: nuclear transport factor 2 family protein [Thermomicrobiales bacterium]|nr:nuclear transport factor 2 family protein [Thermomicrobiales bacterium]